MKNKLPISVCMIVKNEETFIAMAINSVKNVFKLDDIVVVDTGSTDKTKQIAEECGANVVDFVWCDDFAAARNFAMENAKNDWIFYLDADEEITKVDVKKLEKVLADTNLVGLATIINLNDKTSNTLARLYNKQKYHFEGRIHEQIRAIDGQYIIPMKDTGIFFNHHGYLPEYNKVQAKLERNEKMLKKELKKNPDDPYILYQLGKSYFCNNRDLSKACEYFKKSLKSKVDVNIGYTYELVECYAYALINTGKNESALRLMSEFYDFYIDKIRFRFLLAHGYQNNGMFIEAVEAYESCLDADENDKTGISSYLSYYNIGVILECLDMKDEALGMYGNCGDYEP
ncbi:MAG: glycosyltransferase, partial [Oscillospiraceae bacterium]|nr:glycosyltransferase [Oscillospiraceae bacterium]